MAQVGSGKLRLLSGGGRHEKDIDLLSRPLCSVRRPDCCDVLRALTVR
jgi:hypothetical protein